LDEGQEVWDLERRVRRFEEDEVGCSRLNREEEDEDWIVVDYLMVELVGVMSWVVAVERGLKDDETRRRRKRWVEEDDRCWCSRLFWTRRMTEREKGPMRGR